MKFPSLVVLLFAVSYQFNFAQQPLCGFDEMHANKVVLNPSEQNRLLEMNELVAQAIVSNAFKNNAGGTLVIPVVFHIMHNNGPENVNDTVVINAVEELNLRFQNAAPYFDTTGNAINIQFCLATIDPQGNAATGITRTVTSLTNLSSGNDENMKSLDRWSPLLYCNIWIVNEIIGNVAGYATFPNWAGNGFDGIVMEAAYLNNSYVLAHEMGHYCGLAHTWSYSCDNTNCLLQGDQVCDTPPDTSQLGFPCMWNSCTTDAQDTTGQSPFTLDVNELPNYMDYTSCPLSFTQGQGERMEIMVNMYRSQLQNSNACGANPGQPLPVAGFNFSASSCNNGVVSFSDSISINTLTSEWDFNNDGIYEFLGHNFNYTFPASGTYLVKQRVTGYGGQDSISHSLSVMKGSTYNYPIIFPLTSMDTTLVCGGDSLTFQGDAGAISYLWSTGDTTQSITFAATGSLDITLTMTDSNGFTWSSQCTPIHIEVHPYNIPVITYDDTVGYTCAGDLLSLYVANPIPGIYTWQVFNSGLGWFNTMDHNLNYNYYPDPVNGNQFYVTYTNPAGCNQQSNIVTVQPQPIPFLNGVPLFVNGNQLYYNTSNFQYQWYNYNVPIPGATTNFYEVTSTGCYRLMAWNSQYPACDSYTDTVCFMFTDIEELMDGFSVYPNPASDKITVSGYNTSDVDVEYAIWNLLGEEIIKGIIPKNNSSLTIPCKEWRDGIYILQINSGHPIRRKIRVENWN